MSKQKLFVTTIAVVLFGGVLAFGDSSQQSIQGIGMIDDVTDPIQAVYAALPKQAQALYYQQSEGLTKPVPERLVDLDQLTIGCFGSNTVAQMSSEDTNLGGQCCGALKDIEAYNEQLPALLTFIEDNGNVDLIPRDPYDISVEHAQILIDFDSDIVLSSLQTEIYYNAISLSHHGGPCCCRCWKWYMMSGLGKKLIVDYNWNGQQLAQLWDLSSSCGHDDEVNIQKHYSGTKDEY